MDWHKLFNDYVELGSQLKDSSIGPNTKLTWQYSPNLIWAVHSTTTSKTSFNSVRNKQLIRA